MISVIIDVSCLTVNASSFLVLSSPEVSNPDEVPEKKGELDPEKSIFDDVDSSDSITETVDDSDVCKEMGDDSTDSPEVPDNSSEYLIDIKSSAGLFSVPSDAVNSVTTLEILKNIELLLIIMFLQSNPMNYKKSNFSDAGLVPFSAISVYSYQTSVPSSPFSISLSS